MRQNGDGRVEVGIEERGDCIEKSRISAETEWV